MIYSGTGHRLEVLRGADETIDLEVIHHKAVRYAKSILPSYADITQGISGMAIGWDTAFALALLDHGVPVIAAIPFIGQESIWPEHAKKRYHEILDKCAEVHVVCEGGYAPHKYHERDKWMVERGQKMMALWNGHPKGGTAATVRYAKKAGKEIVNVWPGWEIFEIGCPCGCGADSESHCWNASTWDNEGGQTQIF
jgi:hypothetical protein